MSADTDAGPAPAPVMQASEASSREPGAEQSCRSEAAFPGKHLGAGAARRLSGLIPSASDVDGCSRRPGQREDGDDFQVSLQVEDEP